MAAGMGDDVVDWAPALLVGFDDNRRHAGTHLRRHGLDEV